MSFIHTLAKKIRSRLFPLRMSGLTEVRRVCAGKKGLEIGGPSAIFTWKGKIPLYSIVGSLDACNFSGTTMWEGTISEGKNFRFHPKKEPGYQYISEASDLRSIQDGQYDFLLSSHVLEHCADPLKTLREWTRVLRDEGMLLLIVPHRDGTFDHNRDITSFDHLRHDEERHMGEDDTTHMDEFIDRIDLSMTGYGSDRKTFEERTGKNLEFRGMHHHVFDTKLAVRVIDYAGLQIINVQTMLPFHIVVVAQKTSVKNNDQWLSPDFRLRRSPFATDRY
jgi:SAM-dependent methyltransferase